jgi:predicted enzyme related to lactoylglutathione lyase
MITGVDFICLPTNDFEASVKFYEETLGLPRGKQWGEHPGMEFQAGNLTLAIMDSEFFGQEFKPHSLPVALQVDDVPAAKEALEAKGVQFRGEIIDSGTCHQAIFLDPAGNALDLHHIYAPQA